MKPTVEAPARPPEPAPAVAPAAPTGGAACDPTGTWSIGLYPAGEGCSGSQEERFELALGFVRAGEQTTLAGAAKGEGTLAPLLPTIHSAVVVSPSPECGARVVLGPGGPEPARVELLLRRENGGMGGGATLWRGPANRRCRQGYSIVGERRAPQPAEWAKLGPAAPAPTLAAPAPASGELAAKVRALPVKPLLGGVTAVGAQVKLKGSLVDYVAAVVEGPKSVRLVELPCTAAGSQGARCVAAVGDPCGAVNKDEDCEGMYLTVVVDPRSGALDRADAGGYPVESQADVEARLEMAP